MIKSIISSAMLVTTALCVANVLGSDGKPRNAALLAGLSDLKQETINGEVTVDYGTIPEWINGILIRHSCGTFGNTENMDDTDPNYIQHQSDCIETGTSFKIEKGRVTFTNRFYDTLVNDFLNQYDRDMNKSSVFFPGGFSKINEPQMDKYLKFVGNSTKVQQVPHVTWWKIGKQTVAMSEFPTGVIIDPVNVEQNGYVHYQDGNLGYGKEVIFTNNPSHEHEDKDGTVWSAVAVQKFVSKTHLSIWRIVYKMDSTGTRQIVGEHEYKQADLSKCVQGPTQPYPNMDSRFGYLHSFAITKQYIVLPETSYLHDPCVYTHYQKTEAYLQQNFRFEENGFSRLLVMRKSDGKFVASIKTKPFFSTHQLGSYEDGDYIHIDIVMYDDASIYNKFTFLRSLLKNEEYYSNIIRVSINTQNWEVSFKTLRNGQAASIEMPTINQAYNGEKYTYSYLVKNFWREDINTLVKLNVDTGEEKEYVFGDGMFAQEPRFLPKPSPKSEDDGVLLVQGIDGNKDKAFLSIIDAKIESDCIRSRSLWKPCKVL